MTFHSAHSATAPIETIIHKADTTRNIPQTIMDGNVYANDTANLVRVSKPAVNYTSLATWTAAMAASPVGIPGIDANSKAGSSWVNADGSPTSALAAAHGQAVAIPSYLISKYPALATKHYGVLWK